MGWALVRRLGFINIGALAVVARRIPINLTIAVAITATLVAGLIIWSRFRYWLDGDDLVTESGVLSRKRVTVPLERIQSVSTRQSVVHRIFDLVEVQVQTAGSAMAEITLTAVDGEVAQRLRRLATAASPKQGVLTDPTGVAPGATAEPGGSGPAPAPPEPILRRTIPELTRAALSRNPLTLLAPIALVVGVLVQTGDWLEDWMESTVESLFGSPVIIVAAIVIGLLISVVTSVAALLVRFYDLTLVRHGSSLRHTQGLLTRREFSATIERIQGMVRTQNPVERALKIGGLRLPVAGTPVAAGSNPGGPGAQRGSGGQLDLPATTLIDEAAIARIILGPEPAKAPVVHGISRLAWRRWLLWTGVVPAVGFAVLAALGGLPPIPVAMFAGVWTVLVAATTRRYQRSWHWSVGDEVAQTTSGVISRRTIRMAVRKTQTVTLRQGIFHRRHGLADVTVRSAGRVSVVIPMLPLDQAASLRDLLIYRAETDPRPFM